MAASQYCKPLPPSLDKRMENFQAFPQTEPLEAEDTMVLGRDLILMD